MARTGIFWFPTSGDHQQPLASGATSCVSKNRISTPSFPPWHLATPAPSFTIPATKTILRQKVVTTVCGKPPKGLSRWSARTLANRLGVSKSFVHGVLLEHDLHPHRLRTFNFSPDPRFEEKLLDVVGLYMNPPENALVLCMDEKTGIQALDRTQPVLPLRSGKPRAWSNEYVRHGTQTMLAAIELATGRATTWVNKTRKADDFVTFMDQVVREYPGRRLCVVMDNLNTHTGAQSKAWLEAHQEVSFHFTPIHEDVKSELALMSTRSEKVERVAVNKKALR